MRYVNQFFRYLGDVYLDAWNCGPGKGTQLCLFKHMPATSVSLTGIIASDIQRLLWDSPERFGETWFCLLYMNVEILSSIVISFECPYYIDCCRYISSNKSMWNCDFDYQVLKPLNLIPLFVSEKRCLAIDVDDYLHTKGCCEGLSSKFYPCRNFELWCYWGKIKFSSICGKVNPEGRYHLFSGCLYHSGNGYCW